MARIFVESEGGRVRVELTQEDEEGHEWTARCALCPNEPGFDHPADLLADSHVRFTLEDAVMVAEIHADTAHLLRSPSFFDERPF